MLRCGGLLLGVVLIPTAYLKLFQSIKISRKNMVLYERKSDGALVFHSLQSLALFYFVVSLMEGFPPLGPSTSVFILWFMMGIGNKPKRKVEVQV